MNIWRSNIVIPWPGLQEHSLFYGPAVHTLLFSTSYATQACVDVTLLGISLRRASLAFSRMVLTGFHAYLISRMLAPVSSPMPSLLPASDPRYLIDWQLAQHCLLASVFLLAWSSWFLRLRYIYTRKISFHGPSTGLLSLITTPWILDVCLCPNPWLMWLVNISCRPSVALSCIRELPHLHSS